MISIHRSRKSVVSAVLTCFLALAMMAGAAPKKIVFISHQSSHGRGSHEYSAGSKLIGHWLEEAYGDDVAWEHHIDWPADPEKAFAGASTVVFFCSGGGRHLVNKHVPEFDKVMRRGVGLACLHYGVEVPIGSSGKGMLNWMGGYFETNWSVNPHWKADFREFPDHPVANGVEPFHIDDEWYFHMRFRGEMENVTPILSALAPEETMKRKDGAHSGNPAVRKAVAAGEKQHVAWAYQRGADYGNGRGFGFTGLHFHWNFENDDFRKTVLNGVAWTAGLEIPQGGVPSATPSRRDLELSMEGVMPGSKAEAGASTQGQGKPLYESPAVTDATPGNAVAIEVAFPAGSKELHLVVSDAGDGKSHDWVALADAVLVLADGSERKLVDLDWKQAKSGHGKVLKNANAGGKPLRIDGEPVAHGIGAHAPAHVVFDLPDGVKAFKARGGLDDGGVGRSDVASVRFLVFNAAPTAGAASVGKPDTEGEYVKKTSAPGGDAADAVASLDVHPELEATLFASEPMMRSPSSIDIDHRGRVWVCDVVNYRRNQGKRPEGDCILIVEDTDGDGVADKSTVFYEGHDVDSAHGICVLGDRALVSAGEDVFYLIDEDGDDKADRKELLFTKTGASQHDHNIHAVHFGPDGRLYFNFGNASTRLCDKAGNVIVDLAGNRVEEHRNPYQEGMVFRCELDGSKVETLGWNFRNNWEVAVDSFGTIWQSDNDDDGNKAVRINYVMEFGNFGYKDEITGAGWRDPRPGMSQEIPKQHWHLNDPGVVPNMLQTGAGSPTGITVYEGDLLPAIFHGQVIHCDAGPNVCRAYKVVADGAGYRGEMIDILKSNRDRWFRPSDVSVAPDGSLIVADWYDPGVGGHGMGDIEKGRLFRVTPKGKGSLKYQVPSLNLGTVKGAIEGLKSPNEEARYLAWTALRKKGEAAKDALIAMTNPEINTSQHVARALWLLGRLDGGYEILENALIAAPRNPNVQVTALRAIRQLYPEKILNAIVAALPADHPMVWRECAIALRFEDSLRAHELWAGLAALYDGEDRWYLEALGIGADLHWDQRLNAYMTGDGAADGNLIWRSRARNSSRIISRILPEIAGQPSETRQRYFRALHFHPDEEAVRDAYLVLFQKADPEIALAAAGQLGRQAIEAADGGPARLEALLGPVRGTADFVMLAERLHLKGFEGELADFIAANPNANEAVVAAKLILMEPAVARELLRDAEPGKGAGRALALALALGKTGDRGAAELLAGQLILKESSMDLKRAIVSGLAMSTQGGRALLAAAKKGQLDGSLHSLAALALARSSDQKVRDEAAKVLDVPAAVGTENLPPLSELVRLKGNAKGGKAAFTKSTCNTCHRVNGEGIDFGPDLSEIGNKLSREAMFESILHPSNAISEGFNGVQVTTKGKGGSSFVGYVTGETDDLVTLRMAGGVSQNLEHREIRSRDALELSLMPPGLAALLTPQELADLVAYLQSLKQSK